MYIVFAIGLVSFLISLVLTPIVRDAFLRRNIVDRPDHFRKVHKRAIPRVGGIAIAVAYSASFLIAPLIPLPWDVLQNSLSRVALLCMAAGLVFFTGLLDDLVGLKPWQKLLEQLIAAGMAFCAGVQIHLFPGEAIDAYLSLPISIIWIIGTTNAFNLIDGLDGLAAGVGFFATVTVLVAALISNNSELALVTVPLAGALLGFLRYNFNPASVFLGDCGSLLIGFLLGCYGVLWSHKSATLLGMTAPLMAVAIPLLDVLLSITRRFLRGQPIFAADRGHIHHRLLDRGLKPRTAALLIYAASGLAAAFSLLQNVAYHQFGGLIVILFCAAAWIGIQHLGYVEFGMARQMFMKGNFRRIIDAHTRLQGLEAGLAQAATHEELWSQLRQGAQMFGFRGVRLKLHNGVWEEVDESAGPLWQVRVPLPNSQYANFYCAYGNCPQPMIVGEFVQVIEAVLRHSALLYDKDVSSILTKKEDIGEEGASLGPSTCPIV
ncbi:MAG: undecaprenyl/decaprenyl-phosphate alpha-N-acetylglucosaminyl 1-phosphate transferase [Bryobacteraceae bacterium]|nr:undecaprenyl/decaprenyl-phosphate alpha-N-acetylglucosaminyl 1-phosphate transferase [Bryobacteraceae bacterium]